MYIPYLVCVVDIDVGFYNVVVCEMTEMSRDEARQRINAFLEKTYCTITLVRSEALDVSIVGPMLKLFPNDFIYDVTKLEFK